MHVVVDLILLVAVVTAVGGVGRRWDLPAPLLLVVVGIGASFLPRYTGFHIDPEVILVGVLPPLLYAAAIRTSLFDLRQEVRPILALSVGLVVLTTVGVGLAVWWVLPVPLVAALALGAVVAPPDAVAATSIARRVGLPRQMVTILEGESLVNDATALVCLHAAIAGIAGHITAGEVVREFALSAVGGIAIGLAAAWVVGSVRTRIDDTLTDTAIALVTPFGAYVAAEQIHASGVLAVVVAGLVLGHNAPVVQTARSRLLERSTWASIQFLLENSVFLLIGLQLRTILEAVAGSALAPGRIVLVAAVATAAVVAVRIVGVIGSSALLFPGRRVPWNQATVLSWAGMRGVVTLAAASALPAETPHRSVLVLAAFVVTAVTLLGQGFTLPAVIRRARLEADDEGEDLLVQADLIQRSARVGRERLDAIVDAAGTDLFDDVLAKLRQRSTDRADAAWEQLGRTGETPSEQYSRLRLEMIAAERAEVLRVRAEGRVAHDVLAEVLAALDVEESLLDVASERQARHHDAALTLSGRQGCTHVVAIGDEPRPLGADGCEGCAAGDTRWVHLRMCMACGYVGCCDSSRGRHATAHHIETGHPVMRSIEPGEAWLWCYVDERLVTRGD